MSIATTTISPITYQEIVKRGISKAIKLSQQAVNIIKAHNYNDMPNNANLFYETPICIYEIKNDDYAHAYVSIINNEGKTDFFAYAHLSKNSWPDFIIDLSSHPEADSFPNYYPD